MARPLRQEHCKPRRLTSSPFEVYRIPVGQTATNQAGFPPEFGIPLPEAGSTVPAAVPATIVPVTTGAIAAPAPDCHGKMV